jgi:L-Ala-D/L-Glu epimerase
MSGLGGGHGSSEKGGRTHPFEFIPYAIPFRRPIQTAADEWETRRGLWLRFHSDEGAVGLGEAAPIGHFPSQGAMVALLRETGHPCMTSALALAVLDIQGQQGGVPVSVVLDKSSRDDILVNALLFSEDVEEVAFEAAAAVAQGFETLKLKVATLPPEIDLARIAAVRDCIGSEVRIRLDANCGWDEETAVRVLRAAERHCIEYVEDPVSGNPKRIRSRIGIAIAIDDGARTVEAAQAVVRDDLADILVLKPALISGGVRVARQIAIDAIDAGIGVIVTSVFETAIGVAGAIHLAASLPGPERAHGLATVALLQAAPVSGLDPPREGRMRVPPGPGLGVVLEESVA